MAINSAPLTNSGQVRPHAPLSLCTRRTFLSVTSKILSLSGLAQTLPFSAFPSFTAGATSHKITAESILALVKALPAQKVTVHALWRSITHPASELTFDCNRDQEQFEFKMSGKILALFSQENPYSLFHSPQDLSFLSSLAVRQFVGPARYPALMLTLEQIQKIAQHRNSSESGEAGPSQLVPKIRLTTGFTLNEHIAGHLGNLPTPAQQAAWDAYQQERDAISALIHKSGILEDAKFQELAPKIWPTRIIPASPETLCSALTDSLCNAAYTQAKVIGDLRALAHSTSTYPQSFIWNVVRTLTDPHAKESILAMEDVVLRGNLYLALERLKTQSSILQGIEDRTIDLVFHHEEMLLKKGIRIPVRLQGQLEYIYQSRIAVDRAFEEYRYLRKNSIEPLQSLCMSMGTSWKLKNSRSAVGALHNHTTLRFAELSFNNPGWRLKFKGDPS